MKYRKNQISDELCDLGWKSYKDLAKPSRGRGASAGPIDVKGQYFSKRAVVHTKKWSTGYLKPEGKILKTLKSTEPGNIEIDLPVFKSKNTNMNRDLIFALLLIVYAITFLILKKFKL